MEKIRGSIDLPLTPKGRRHAMEIGRFFARSRLDGSIYSSNLLRASETAEFISEATGWPIKEKSEALQPWHLGILEGQDVKEVDPILTFLAKNPDLPAPGRAKAGTKAGESFDTFRTRFLGKMRLLLSAAKKEDKYTTVIVTHHRDIVTLDAWLKAGKPTDYDFRKVNVTDSGEDPGAVFHLVDDKMEKVDPLTARPQAGIYIVRHGDTEFNG